MKYLVILILVVLMVRADFFLRLFDQLNEKMASRQPEIQTTDLEAPRTMIPMDQDQSLKQEPRQIFLGLLERFRINPSQATREQAFNYFKDHPTIFSQKRDIDLEATIYRWRDLLHNNEPEVANFLVDLLNILQGENQTMVRRFFSLWMEIDMENFLAAYSRTKDTNCLVARMFGDNIPEEEKLNEFYAREDAIKEFLTKKNTPPAQMTLARSCLTVLELEINKLNPTPVLPGPAIDPGTEP